MSLGLEGGYDFFTPGRVVFGWGRRKELGRLARSLGRRAFVVHGSRTLERAGTLAELVERLEEAGVASIPLGSINREPEVSDVDTLALSLRAHEARAGTAQTGEYGDLVLAVGGGAAIDLAKAACAMATNTESATVQDYLEGVGRGLELHADPLPLLAMPTTAGTGSEATKNAVISNLAPAFKKSLRADRMVPRIALVDPELAVTLPPRTTAYTGMDAITQLIESYISVRARPLPQALALQGLELAAPALARAVRDGGDREAREDMAHAALLSGMALANSGLGMAHGVAAALGIHCGVAHGLACAVMLPAALRANRERRGRELAKLGRAFCRREFASDERAVDALLEGVQALSEAVGIPRRLGELGVRREQVPELVRSSRGNSMSGNPRPLDDGELAAILEEMI